ncbi:hypothetical protein GALL_478780 [mine drainage metagenome]|uniref:Uncharacterized protein n=1 Tax=mine drainage metagenome TaxID=410659 RepID=A0A1J5PGF8_9ZZZZ
MSLQVMQLTSERPHLSAKRTQVIEVFAAMLIRVCPIERGWLPVGVFNARPNRIVNRQVIWMCLVKRAHQSVKFTA